MGSMPSVLTLCMFSTMAKMSFNSASVLFFSSSVKVRRESFAIFSTSFKLKAIKNPCLIAMPLRFGVSLHFVFYEAKNYNRKPNRLAWCFNSDGLLRGHLSVLNRVPVFLILNNAKHIRAGPEFQESSFPLQ